MSARRLEELEDCVREKKMRAQKIGTRKGGGRIFFVS
jgi:hypothetical protein